MRLDLKLVLVDNDVGSIEADSCLLLERSLEIIINNRDRLSLLIRSKIAN